MVRTLLRVLRTLLISTHEPSSMEHSLHTSLGKAADASRLAPGMDMTLQGLSLRLWVEGVELRLGLRGCIS